MAKTSIALRLDGGVVKQLRSLAKSTKLSQGRIVEEALKRQLVVWLKDAGDILRAKGVVK